jgi:hypothetical protein
VHPNEYTLRFVTNWTWPLVLRIVRFSYPGHNKAVASAETHLGGQVLINGVIGIWLLATGPHSEKRTSQGRALQRAVCSLDNSSAPNNFVRRELKYTENASGVKKRWPADLALFTLLALSSSC